MVGEAKSTNGTVEMRSSNQPGLSKFINKVLWYPFSTTTDKRSHTVDTCLIMENSDQNKILEEQ